MSTQEPRPAPAPPVLAALPRLEDLPTVERGYDPGRVREAFEVFRRHASQVQAQLRVLQAAGRVSHVEPTGNSVRMDALHLIRAAAEFADTLERDAQTAASVQLARTEEEVRRKIREVQERDADLERYQQESERPGAELINAAKAEAREIVAGANRDASREVREAEARAARLLEQARHQATELTNSARAEVDQTLEWARSQASVIIARAQEGAEQLLRAAGLGEAALAGVVETILEAARESAETSRQSREQEVQPAVPQRPAIVPPPAPTVPGAAESGEGPPTPPEAPAAEGEDRDAEDKEP